MKHNIQLIFTLFFWIAIAATSLMAQPSTKVKKMDTRRDVKMVTDSGTFIIRLSDSTPIHRDNFIKLVRSRFYEGISFHRVISGFMIQAGDEKSRIQADSTRFLKDYTLPAEFIPSLYHRKGVIAAARWGDDINPQRNSSGVQFYIVQGRIHNNFTLDSAETYRLKGRKLPLSHREVYKQTGGTPHLDQNYTIFGALVSGFDVLDKIGNTATSGKTGGDKPLTPIRIIQTRMVKRKSS
ncbi:MAG: peptidylprolyl isomerase [Bacteroidota bacterium]|jgi:peptidyl-prolyl cis-trans isomerase B (cyclophilin B)